MKLTPCDYDCNTVIMIQYLNSNLAKSRLLRTYFSVVQSFCNFTAVLCAKLQNDWATEMDVIDERDFARFEFEMSLLGVSSTVYNSPQPNGHITQ